MASSPPPRTILLVDDEPAFREMVGLMLEAGGHQVTTAANGRAGETLLEQKSFDLVITDVLMPEQDGLAFISSLRQRQPGARIIAMTGGGMVPAASYLRIARGLGAHSLLEKPFGQDELLAAVESALATEPKPPAS